MNTFAYKYNCTIDATNKKELTIASCAMVTIENAPQECCINLNNSYNVTITSDINKLFSRASTTINAQNIKYLDMNHGSICAKYVHNAKIQNSSDIYIDNITHLHVDNESCIHAFDKYPNLQSIKISKL